jgi:hypothetical protein
MAKAKKILITTTVDEVIIVRHGKPNSFREACPLCGSELLSPTATAKEISAVGSGTDLCAIVTSPKSFEHQCDPDERADKTQKGEKR